MASLVLAMSDLVFDALKGNLREFIISMRSG